MLEIGQLLYILGTPSFTAEQCKVVDIHPDHITVTPKNGGANFQIHLKGNVKGIILDKYEEHND